MRIAATAALVAGLVPLTGGPAHAASEEPGQPGPSARSEQPTRSEQSEQSGRSGQSVRSGQRGQPAEPGESGRSAQPLSLFAPSAMVLTIGKGEDPQTATVERAVTLRCAPTARGDHPDPRAACSELRGVNGKPGLLVKNDPGRVCPFIHDPVTVTAEGVWQGRRMSYSATFSNSCVMKGKTTQLFDF
ncbi:subtilase-type protease inhibitor [Streptomyces sp. bgisy100]|uniref:subtilase-type protease inhibitor n=1 Tax=Streptomyces sp. bgisy100 TaxID=3413783 RepID=UPI003D729108